MTEDIKDLQSVAFLGSRSRNNVVKISFHSNYVSKGSSKNNLRMQISIGNDVARQLKWKHNDRIEIKHADNQIILRKMDIISDKDYKNFKGFKLVAVKGSYSFNINMLSFLTPVDMKIRTVPHEIIALIGGEFLKILWEEKENENT